MYVAGTNAVVRFIPAMANADDLDAPIIYQDTELLKTYLQNSCGCACTCLLLSLFMSCGCGNSMLVSVTFSGVLTSRRASTDPTSRYYVLTTVM